MALLKTQKEDLIRRRQNGELPEEREVRAMVERFLALSGYTEGELADAVGYSRSAINLFRIGRYIENHPSEHGANALCAALKDFVEPKLEQHAHLGAGSSATVYRTGNYSLVRKAFYRALDQGCAYCVDGAPGTRKTFLLRSLIADLERVDASKNGHGRRAFFVRCPARRKGHVSPTALMQRVAKACGVPVRGSIEQLMCKLQFTFAGRRVLLVFDEAHRLDDDCIEMLRDLLDMPPYIGAVFAGSHDLRRIFERLEMEQWRSRLVDRIELRAGVTAEEAAAIIESELHYRPKKAELEELLRGFRVKDVRRNHPVNCKCDDCTYISARSLFLWIQQVKLGEVADAASA